MEIIDLKTRKQSLKRIKYGSITLQDLFVGNTLDIYGKRYKIVEYGDQSTKEALV